MKIDLTELLKETGNELEVNEKLDLSFPEDGLVTGGPVAVDLHLLNAGEVVILKGIAKAVVNFTCSRCLNEFPMEVKADIEEQYSKKLPEAPAGKKELELSDEDMVFPIDHDNTIDLTEALRQNLLMSIPIKTVCSQSCKGIVEKKKKEKKVDPRLAKLREFKRR